MENYAEASCILKVNIHCQACKMKILEVLGSICGEYNIDINIEEGLVKVYAMVEPNILMKALSRTGYHAELKWAKIQHPKSNRNYYNHTNGYGYGYDSYNYHGHGSGPIDYPYGYSRALPDPYSYSSHNYPTSSTYPYYNGSGSDPYHYGPSMQPGSGLMHVAGPGPLVHLVSKGLWEIFFVVILV
ncbi:hypothetical protein CASFOL_018688 [Castilleja foliolosa]|uniref:HMA domain-containing protein n=1 Tax=Castilleja foliolosa TaxID=1961234 RepID=A0ABD3D5G0_9LAMI